MNNIKDFNSADFGEFLLKTAIVPEDKEKFIVVWVRKFFSVREKWPDFPWHEQLGFFLRELDTSGFQPWQLRQADQAVRIYFSNYLGKATEANQKDALNSHEIQPSHYPLQRALKLFIENLRLKHYARSTEKTYCFWIRNFFYYLHKLNPSLNHTSQLNQSAVRDFLAFLAVKKNVSASTQNIAFNALLTFFRIVLHIDLTEMHECLRATQIPHEHFA
jgi:hypothetical protein